MDMKLHILDSPPPPDSEAEPYYDWLEEEDERQEMLEEERIDDTRRWLTEKWVEDEPEPGDMVNSELPPDNTSTAAADADAAATTTPFVGLEQVEKIMYEPRIGRNNYTSEYLETTHHPYLKRYPLALYRRFESEVAHLVDQCQHADDDVPLRTGEQAEEIVYRQWEHIFSSRMPFMGAPVPTWNGKPHRKDVTYQDGEWIWELIFMRRFLEYLKLIGDPADHPSQAIRMPKALADDATWQLYIKNQAWYFEKNLGERNSWLPFLLTRPFVVFRVMCDAENFRQGELSSESLMGKSWRDNGWWIGGHSHGFQDCDGPGWTWPGENPTYILDDLPPTLGSSWDNWLGNPQGPQQRLDSPPPRSITEGELQDDPDLSKRTPYYDGDWRRRNYQSAWSVTCKAPQKWLKEALRDHLNGIVPRGVRREKLDFDMYYVVGPGVDVHGRDKRKRKRNSDDDDDDDETGKAGQEPETASAEAHSSVPSASGLEQSSVPSTTTPPPTTTTLSQPKHRRQTARKLNGNKAKKLAPSKLPAARLPQTSPPLRRSSRVAARHV